YSAAAEAIVRASGVRRGFCLVLGSETGRLALELARRTQLRIIGIEPDGAKVAAARKALDAAGLYGARVTVDQGDLARLPYASYFANLIVSDSALLGKLPATPPKEVLRVLKPCGGVLMIGQPAGTPRAALDAAALRQWATAGKLAARMDSAGGTWARFTRGPLPGAGSWTHEYGDAANTTCGDDTFIKCPIGLLWFGDPGPLDMVSRHRRAAGPLAFDGMLFVQSENAVAAYDAYNGLKLWQRQFPGVVRVMTSHDASNLAADRESIFVVTGANQCLRLDAKTGATKYTYTMPEVDEKPRRWAYVAVSNGVLVGSGSRTDISYGRTGPPLPPTAASAPAKTNIVSDLLFALDVKTGTTRWTWAGQAIPHASISVADGHVFFADGGLPAETKKAGPLSKPSIGNPMRKITSLDLNDGSVAWSREVDLTGALGGSYFSTLGSIAHNGSLVLFGVYTDEACRRQGLAFRNLAAVLSRLRHLGGTEAELHVYADNA
ncbi:MAG: GNAT family N-acetyltransferase, partial [Verrucomicrobiae bacterium]|nr:GNAT family N-acetyltransferase [Verrucomicrobiae bacterium]